jgi:murein DD-endopeptidase MepM/ murein hydrolase activator NlpD
LTGDPKVIATLRFGNRIDKETLMNTTQPLLLLSAEAANDLIASAVLPSTVPTLTGIADSFDFPLRGYQWLIPYDYQNRSLRGPSRCYNQPMANLWHAGEDWGTAAGTAVKAVANGTVVFADPNYSYPGRVMIIRHELPDRSRIYSLYGHLATMSVAVNARVTKGQVIGTILNQHGNSHLHWEIRTFQDGSFLCSRSGKPGPGYTYPDHPDLKGYRNPSQFVKNHRALLPGDHADIQPKHSHVPTTMYVGETKAVHVRVYNNGTTTWTPEAGYRLGAEYEGAANQVTWRNFQCGGYMHNPTDGRVYLCSVVSPDAFHEFHFHITAPGMPRTVRLAVRMVREGVTWFGKPFVWNIAVA